METNGRTADVIVIGAGAIGICAAYYLARSGRSVIVIERGEVCSGCSYGNACLITPSHAVPLPAPGVIQQALKWMLHEDSPFLIRPRLDFRLLNWLVRFAGYCRVEPMMRGIPVVRDLCRSSLGLFEEIARTEKLDFCFERRGLLYVNSTEAGFEKGKRSAELLARYGLESKILTGPEAHKLDAAVLPAIPGAFYYPEDAHGDPQLFVTGLARLLAGRGVAVYPHTSASGLVLDGAGQVGVSTSQGTFTGRDLVIATGSWIPELTRPLGLHVPVQPGKGYSVTIAKPECSPLIPVIHQEKKVTITPIGDRLRFAGTMEFAGMDLRMNDVRAEAALRAGRGILAPFAEARVMERWCGLRPCTPDGLPIIDRVPGHRNIYIASGHAMLGYTMGPITGKLLSEMIAGEPLSLPAGPLRLERF